MDAFVSRKRARLSEPEASQELDLDREEPTDVKLAILASIHPGLSPDGLLDVLVSCEGSVEKASALLESRQDSAAVSTPAKRAAPASFLGVQSSLSSHVLAKSDDGSLKPLSETSVKPKSITTQKGRTLHLFDPQDVANQTPCTIVHNFLPAAEANSLLAELLEESEHFSRYEFQLFSRTVKSPHSACVYVSTPEEQRQQSAEYTYGGTYRANIRQATPELRGVSRKVQRVANEEIQKRIREIYPDGKKLKYQSSKEWRPNAAFVNCYDGPGESVGYHSDDLTYLGPHPIIGSLSLGVEREFRIRRVVPRDDEEDPSEDHRGGSPGSLPQKPSSSVKGSTPRSDAQGQIAIHLPHNSLLIMHAEMQEEWKHSIAPAQTVSPHPIAGNKRINITYRWYRDSMNPRYTPRCRCGTSAIMRCAKNKQETRGRYMWMCYAGYEPGKQGCSFFQWAEFDDEGDPVWKRENADLAPGLDNFAQSQE